MLIKVKAPSFSIRILYYFDKPILKVIIRIRVILASFATFPGTLSGLSHPEPIQLVQDDPKCISRISIR